MFSSTSPRKAASSGCRLFSVLRCSSRSRSMKKRAPAASRAACAAQGVGDLPQADHALGGQQDGDGADVPFFRVDFPISHATHYITRPGTCSKSIARPAAMAVPPLPWRPIAAMIAIGIAIGEENRMKEFSQAGPDHEEAAPPSPRLPLGPEADARLAEGIHPGGGPRADRGHRRRRRGRDQGRDWATCCCRSFSWPRSPTKRSSSPSAR